MFIIKICEVSRVAQQIKQSSALILKTLISSLYGISMFIVSAFSNLFDGSCNTLDGTLDLSKLGVV